MQAVPHRPLEANREKGKGKVPYSLLPPPQPLTGLLGLLGELLRALRAVGHWVTERSVLLAGVRVLPGRVVRNLNLLGRLDVALGLQHLLRGDRVP